MTRASRTTRTPGGGARRLPWRRALPAVIPLALLLAATAVATLVVAREVHEDQRISLDRAAQATTDAIDRRILAYTEVLYGLRGLFESPRPVSRQAFREYVRSQAVQSRFPGVHALSFAEAVDEFERRSHELAVRRDARRSDSPYPPGFRIKPASARPRHVVVSYIEPVEGNELAVGLDLLSESRRRFAVERAQRTGRLAATAPIRLAQETGEQSGFLMLLAARNVAGALSSPGTGRFEGVVAGVIRMGDFVAGSVPAKPDFEVEVYDVGVSGARRPARPALGKPIYDQDGTPDAPLGVDAERARLSTLNVGGRRWAIYYERSGGLGTVQALEPWLVGGGGLVLSLLVAALALTTLARRDSDQHAQAEREAQRLKNEFFALVSHELRTPLTSVIGYLELLAEHEAERLSGTGSEFLDVLDRNAKRLERLVSDLLLVTQVEAGTFSVELGAADLGILARNSVEAARPRAEEAGVALGLVADRAPLRCAGDAQRLAQALDNLVSNALKFTPAGGRVEVRLRERAGRALIEVQDTGVGIAAADQERLFERFFRGSTATEGHVVGAGLGLPIVKAIMEAHGGRVEVSSQDGAGATFRIELPLSPGVAGPTGARELQPSLPG